ncbi:UBX domain-containing protein [Colletotrichum higginsianum IMI 349063]|uniref:UBX domain-containing protein n=2 Tax=Colletotrichum higginsianum TaxID=80884 RepID=A0A1B7XXH4_COLHI|nr:UBX domain-containing protein [Colletotrichum higginsianum IMI 349063]OBR04477.1 UBX domain-containing protein [Colletotrichum higginsianum IMI 349063]TIC89707.1 UBX domain-containing protein 5 [Colletotrichum higginsianum]
MDEAISNFVAITAATPEAARGFLEMTNNNIEQAIQLFFESPDLQNSFNSAPAATSSTAPPVPSSTRPNAGRQDERGVIHIDSDDDEDTAMTVDDMDDNFGHDDSDIAAHAQVEAIARNAQEEEDAAMAKRLQEELYGGGGVGGGGGGGGVGGGFGGGQDDVRSPIARTTETLVGGYEGDDGMDLDTIIRAQMRQREAARAARGGAANPFNHNLSIWDDDGPTPPQQPAQAASNEGGSRAQRLAELFRPPYDIMSRLDWDEARQEGKDEKKWILVNLQDMSDFNCQALNRDIWKDEAIRHLLEESFIFLQYDRTAMAAQQYINFYFHGHGHENPENYPHVAIIDPRTGEQVKVWSGRPFPSASDFHAQLAEFLDRYSLAANSKNPVVDQAAPRPKTIDVDRMTEEEMLEMALQNSLAASNGGSGSGSGSSSSKPTSNVIDPDALTKSESPKVEAAEAEAASASASQSIWTKIASDKPHTEPENNPATTTRIQFRHPTGRVIRRFTLDDSVRRIYEWLKSEPLEGKGGVEFELKRMPQGQDLTQDLDKTILEAGLKQGTVMIEFIED